MIVSQLTLLDAAHAQDEWLAVTATVAPPGFAAYDAPEDDKLRLHEVLAEVPLTTRGPARVRNDERRVI